MRLFFVVAAISLSAMPYASAGCVGSVVNGNCLGTYIDNPNIGSDSSTNQDHQSSGGTSYQYDLSNPSDQRGYSLDLDAQRRDQMNLNPSRNLDRGVGQYGGGINNNH